MKSKYVLSLFAFAGLVFAILFPGCERNQTSQGQNTSSGRVSTSQTTHPTQKVNVPSLDVAWRLDSLPDGARVSTIPVYCFLVDGSGSMI
jgi:hypothetical protein